MEWKIKPKEHKKNKMAFVFMPRFCEVCLTAYWLEKIPFYWKESWWSPKCPKDGSGLWSSVSSARSYHKE